MNRSGAQMAQTLSKAIGVDRGFIDRDFLARATLFSTAGSDHSGMMIALYPPPQVAEQLAGITGVETPVEEMHITLLYVGNVQEMTDQQVASVIFVTSLWARNFHPFTLKVNGIGRFNASDGSDGKDVLYAVIDGHEIDILRMEVAHELLMHGIELRKDHGFNPHITLAYVEQGSDSPITQVPTIEFEVASLSLAIGDKIAHYGLGSGEESGETVEPADDEDDEDDDDLPMPTGNTAEMDAEEQEEGDPPVSRALTFFDRMKDAYQSLHRIFGDPSMQQRDMAVGNVFMQAATMLEKHNETLGENWDQFHYMQELYVGDDGSMYVISVSSGRLYKWTMTVDAASDTVAIGEPTQVTQVFSSSSESRALNVRQREDGRYEAFSILSTAMLNKDGQIDSRTLFDDFVRRFRGDGTEYINVYHIGHDATKIGELRAIFREGNLLIGYYVLDDNIVAQRVGETLSGEDGHLWGGSIEFWTEEEPAIVRVADNVQCPVFRSGILLGYSIALAADGAAWGTKHWSVNRMTEDNRKKVAMLLRNDQAAMVEFEKWVDEADQRTRQPGVVTHTVTSRDAVVAQAVDDGTGNEPAEITTGVDEEMVQWLIERIATSEWGTGLESRLSELMDRASSLEAEVATLTGGEPAVKEETAEESVEEQVADDEEETDVEMQVMSDRLEHTVEAVTMLTDRFASVEQTLQRLANMQLATTPAMATVTTPARPAAVQKRPTEQERTSKDGKKTTLGWKPTGLFNR